MKSYDEKIADLEEKQRQLKAQEKALRARKSEEERKARTRRLIQVGAAIESVLGQPCEEDILEYILELLRRNGTVPFNEEILASAGSIMAEVLGRELQPADLPKLRRYLEAQEARGGYFSRAMS